MNASLLLERHVQTRTYCGPAILMLALGMSCDEAENVIRRRRGRRGMVRGTQMEVLLGCLGEGNIKVREVSVRSGVTLRQFSMRYTDLIADQLLVRTTTHILLVVDGKIHDNNRADGVPIYNRQPGLGKKVVSVHQLQGELRIDEGIAEARATERTSVPRRPRTRRPRRRRVVLRTSSIDEMFRL